MNTDNQQASAPPQTPQFSLNILRGAVGAVALLAIYPVFRDSDFLIPAGIFLALNGALLGGLFTSKYRLTAVAAWTLGMLMLILAGGWFLAVLVNPGSHEAEIYFGLLVAAQLVIVVTGQEAGRKPDSDPIPLWRKIFSPAIALLAALLWAAVIIPSFVRSPIRANEANAIGTLRNIINCVVTFQIDNSEKGFPSSHKDLGPQGSNCLSEENATGEHNGYRFSYTPGPVDENGAVIFFEVTASPLEFDRMGTRGFLVNESGVIYFTNENRPANTKNNPFD